MAVPLQDLQGLQRKAFSQEVRLLAWYSVGPL